MNEKTFKVIAGNDKFEKIVKINGCTGLAKDCKPSGRLVAVVEGTEVETGKKTWYLCILTDCGLGIYATQVEREINKIVDVLADCEDHVDIACTEGISRKTNQKFFKINVTDFQ